MNSRKEFCNEIIKLINEKPSEIVFFTGAGISHNPPSSLPLANEVKLELIETICKRSEKTSINQFYQLHQCQIKEYLGNIFVESIFEIIMFRQGLNEQRVTQIVSDVFSAKSPNNNHIFLARLVKIGCNVISTNFDLLIEEAIKKEFSHNVDVNQLTGRIMHIHGSITNAKSIITTLSLVGQGLPEKIGNELKNALKNKILIFAGWSDKDIDITPMLFLSNIERVYWIDHNGSKDKVVHYSDDEIKNSKDHIDELIKKFRGTKYIGNTDDVVSEVWQGLWKNNPSKHQIKTNSKWKKPIKRLLEDLKEWDRILIFLEVLDRIDPKKELPLKLIEKLEKDFSGKEFSEIKRPVLFELYCKKSVCNRIISKYEEAKQSAEQGLEKIISMPEDFSWLIELKNDIASAYNDWGVSHRREKEYERAIEKHKKAIKIFEENLKKLNDKLGELRSLIKEEKMMILLDKAQVHINLGSTYLALDDTCSQCSKSSNFLNDLLDRAEENYREGIKIHENLKDKLSGVLKNYNETKLGSLYCSIAIAYSKNLKKEEAKKCYEKSLKIIKKCGDVRRKQRLFRNYLLFIEKNNLELKNLEAMLTENEILKSVFIEAPSSFFQLHLLRRKEKFSLQQQITRRKRLRCAPSKSAFSGLLLYQERYLPFSDRIMGNKK